MDDDGASWVTLATQLVNGVGLILHLAINICIISNFEVVHSLLQVKQYKSSKSNDDYGTMDGRYDEMQLTYTQSYTM